LLLGRVSSECLSVFELCITRCLTTSSDDGSGTIGILAVAKALTKFRVNNAVRFAFWSAEEFGLLGSYAYIKTINGTDGGSAAELAKVRAYLNFDMVCPHLAPPKVSPH